MVGTNGGWILHSAGAGWVRRGGSSNPIREIWGASAEQLFAISSGQSRYASEPSSTDSLLAFDGRRWKPLHALTDSALSVSYRAGHTLDDGTVILAGSVCYARGCRPLLLQRPPGALAWREIPLQGMARLRLENVWGDDPEDFYVGALDRRAVDSVEWAGTVRCSLGTPCLVHIVHGQAEPVAELAGRRPLGMARLGSQLHVLFADGTLWARVGRRWVLESELPDLQLRDISANKTLGISAIGVDGTVIGLSRFGAPLVPVDTTDDLVRVYRRIVALDTAMVLLAESGEVFSSGCRPGARWIKTGEPVEFHCGHPFERVDRRDRRHINDIAVSEDGELIAVGDQALVTSWKGSRMRLPGLPPLARAESLVRVVAAPGLPTTALGQRLILEDSGGDTWAVRASLLPSDVGRGTDLAVTKDGALVVIKGELVDHWRLMLYPRTSPPRAVLDGVGRPPRLHVLPDGRIVLAHAHPDDRRLGGWLTVLASPLDTVGSLVELPNKMDAYALDDDGERLYVAGSGLQFAIAKLDSLPRTGERQH